MTDPLSSERTVVDGVPVIALRGELDFVSVAGVRGRLAREITPSDSGMVLDLSHVDYVDSAGVHLLVELSEGLTAHRQRLWLVAPPGSPVRRLAFIAGLDSLMPVEETVQAAVAGLTRRR
jgi:anti-anti-sigma factor